MLPRVATRGYRYSTHFVGWEVWGHASPGCDPGLPKKSPFSWQEKGFGDEVCCETYFFCGLYPRCLAASSRRCWNFDFFTGFCLWA